MKGKKLKLKRLKKGHPALWVPTLYFSEGLPFVATSVVSVLMYKSLGLKDSEIALFTPLVTVNLCFSVSINLSCLKSPCYTFHKKRNCIPCKTNRNFRWH